jgi:uracil-DNA glycosylase
VAVGRYAIKWCLKRGFDLATEHGRKFEIQIGDHKTFCVPIYHPSTWGRVERELRDKADVLAVARFLQETGLPVHPSGQQLKTS